MDSLSTYCVCGMSALSSQFFSKLAALGEGTVWVAVRVGSGAVVAVAVAGMTALSSQFFGKLAALGEGAILIAVWVGLWKCVSMRRIEGYI